MKAKLAVQLYGESLVGRECRSADNGCIVTITEVFKTEFSPIECIVAHAEDRAEFDYAIKEGDDLTFGHSAMLAQAVYIRNSQGNEED